VINEATRPRANAGGQSMTGWSDETSAMPRFLNERADLLWQMGLFDTAIAQLQEASSVFAQAGQVNADQRINLARYHARQGQAERARTAVDDLRNLTSYGEMLVIYVQLLAVVNGGTWQATNTELGALERRRNMDPHLYQRALVLADRLDEAAEFLIERLDDETLRIGALVEMQGYLDDLFRDSMAPLDRLHSERKAALLARPDVKAAIEKVGRIESLSVWFGGFEL
jgi:ATP/maltotriose-dependent transcriptional regulator MalT